MKKISFAILGLVLMAGCVPAIIAGGLVVGYSLSSDSASGNVKAEYRELWDICLERLATMDAELISANESKGIIKAKISDNSLTLRIDTINSMTQRLRVSSRRYLLPRPQYAQQVFFKIVEDL